MTQFYIGDKVRVTDQPEIEGTIARYLGRERVLILDDDDSWQTEDEEPLLEFRESELTLITPCIRTG